LVHQGDSTLSPWPALTVPGFHRHGLIDPDLQGRLRWFWPELAWIGYVMSDFRFLSA